MSNFSDAVGKYGVPDQVRTGLGGENVGVWRYMVEQHSSSLAVLNGASTHNERIKHLWRDVYRCVSVLFHDLFWRMGDDGSLGCLNEVDMFCLHYALLPRINQALEGFVESWNNHPVSTCQNLSPNQLFIQGALRQNMTPTLPVPSVSHARIPAPRDIVEVPRSSFNRCDDLQQELQQVDTLRQCDNLGYSVYRRVSCIVMKPCTIALGSLNLHHVHIHQVCTMITLYGTNSQAREREKATLCNCSQYRTL